MMPVAIAKWDDRSIELPIEIAKLQQIGLDLEVILVAIAALTQIDRVEIGHVAQELQVQSVLTDWLQAWPRPTLSSPAGRDFLQIRSLILVVHHLACKYQQMIRQQISYWQQIVHLGRLPIESPGLATYIGNFIELYQTRFGQKSSPSVELLTQTALNLLTNLLFCSNFDGHNRLWTALLQRYDSTDTPPKPT